MNFQNPDFDYAEQPRHYSHHLAADPRTSSNHSGSTLRPQAQGDRDQDRGQGHQPEYEEYDDHDDHLEHLNGHLEPDYASSRPASPSTQPPRDFPHAPTPPSIFSSTESEIYGPDRHSGPALVADAQAYARPVVVEGPVRRAPDLFPPPVLPQQPAWETAFNATMLTDFRDDLARLAGVVTPGVDDTPYIQYAIEALTRDRDTGYSANASSSSDEPNPVSQFASEPAYGYYPPPSTQQQQQQPQAYDPAPTPLPFAAQPPRAHLPAEPEDPSYSQSQYLMPPRPNAGASADSLASTLPQGTPRPVQPHEWVPLDRDAIIARIGEQKANGLPALNFKPWVLRMPSFILFVVLCVLMVAGLIFCAVFSDLHPTLWTYTGTYDGRYFLFRIFPQLLAAVILLYAQFIVATMFRILPFVHLASDHEDEREGAVFEDLYPRSFLWPQLIGTWHIWVPILIVWLINLTIPLQSSLFTVVLLDGVWKWATVQGVAWTLVALYLALLAATVVLCVYWARVESTGLIWDPRSLADIVAIVSDTNTASDYQGTQIAGTREGIKFALRRQADVKLGYWTWKDGRPGFWYTIGSPMDSTSSVPVPGQLAGKGMMRHQEKQGYMMTPSSGLLGGDNDPEAGASSPQARHRYIPWCLRSNQLLYFVITTFILLLALFIVCFLPATHITTGFRPWLPSAPRSGAFSAADFLYSFLPSLLGMILFLLFQSLDLSLRILQPWAALSDPRGAHAEQSLLADYPACAPIQTTIRALRNGHWRVAAISLLSTLFILIPVLAGGIFMALTTADGEVRMYPNVPTLAVVLTLLVLYFLALVALFPRRQAFRLPHAVTCLAEIISFVANEDLLNDLSFKQCRGRDEMLSKMGLGRGVPETRPRWIFGVGTGSVVGGADETLGVRRARRFTEKRKVRKSQIKRKRPTGF
ncbi:hypothetical protein B0T19DRAFT_378587 [Cercophora scortea]|uniref:Phosphoribosylaminoimidazole-succinocarboxamide synthase n=1 Tax=Cercophora scortea TaxID=314031 RepID=A0AAE0J4B8_9PEZI|nr:hypothetical protein B0T19DRAFT_378587 [Cercophora scortea]